MKKFLITFALLIPLSLPALPIEGEITVWCMGSEGNSIPALARDFERENPGVRIHTQPVPWNGAHDRLITAVAGNIAPDVTQLGTTWVPEFAAMDSLLPLDSMIEQSPDLNKDDFFPSSLATAVWNNTTYAVPWYVDVRVVFYRSDILEEAGWDHYPETWEELERMAAKVTRDLDGDGQTDQHAINVSGRDEALILPFIWGAGGSVLDDTNTRVIIDSPETREALAFYQSLFKRGFTTKAESGQIDQFQAFRDGYFLSWITGPWMVGEYERRLPDLEGKWKVAMVPGKKTRSSFLGGSNLAIFRQSKNPGLAWAFIEYLSRPDVQMKWYQITGDLPSVRQAWDDPSLSKSPTWSVFRSQLEKARAVPAVECWEAMAEEIKNEMENLVLGGTPPGRIAEKLQKSLERIMDGRRSGEGNLARRGFLLLVLFPLLLIAGIFILLYRIRHELTSWRKWITPVLFILPVLVHLTLFMFLPILASLFLSFTDFDIYSIGDWRKTSLVGVRNYLRLIMDPLFWQAVFNTGYFIIFAGPLTIGLALGAALLLNSPKTPLKGFFRTGYFLPVVTPLIAVAVVWRWIYSPRHGLLNWAIGLFGMPEQSWLADPALAMPCLIILAVWKNFGYSMVIFLAGLQAIPPAVYEAASIDGAGRWHTFRHVTLPLLRPTMLFITIITTIGYMQFFAEPYVMTEMGGPQNKTLSVVLYLYKEGFRFFHLGYASAMAYTLCFAIAVLSFFQLRWAMRKEAM